MTHLVTVIGLFCAGAGISLDEKLVGQNGTGAVEDEDGEGDRGPRLWPGGPGGLAGRFGGGRQPSRGHLGRRITFEFGGKMFLCPCPSVVSCTNDETSRVNEVPAESALKGPSLVRNVPRREQQETE